MAARKVRGQVRQRKVTVFTRPPDLNVILESESPDQGQSQNPGQDCPSDVPYPGHSQNGDLDAGSPRRLPLPSVTSETVTSAPEEDQAWCAGACGEWNPATRGREEQSAEPSGDELHRLKEYTARLNLPTRRPSYAIWREQHFGPGDTPLLTSPTEGAPDVTWSAERCTKMDAMLQAIREDLQWLRDEDQVLARRLMTLRRHIHDVKVSRYYEANRDLLEEAMFNEERDEVDEVCDLPPRLFSPALKHYGVTRMNVQTRRFSVF